MKTFKLSTIIAAGAIAALGFAPKAFAFHEGGVAYCDGCHTMHNSAGNKAVAGFSGTYSTSGRPVLGKSTQFLGLNQYLLQGTDQSSTCLNCHASNEAVGSGYHVMTGGFTAGTNTTQIPRERTAGGDFAWLQLTFSGLATYGAPVTSKAERHGHNVIATDYGLVADATLLAAPGGGATPYSAANLSCISCHDPHSRARIVDANGTIKYNQLGLKTLPIEGSGSYGGVPTATEAKGVYRLLGGVNYVQDSNGYQFTADPPVAVAPATFNASEATAENRVAYGKGMSEWCANCHSAIHNNQAAGTAPFIHPTGPNAKLSALTTVYGVSSSFANVYNAYVASGDLSGGQTNSYTTLVPYEEGTGVIATLATAQAGTKGPGTGTENVMCLTCHRAHAGGFDSMTRWNNRGEYLTVGGQWPGSDSTVGDIQTNGKPLGAGAQFSLGMNQAQYSAAMYDRPATKFASYQRSLCNKCHAKD